jgi:hypothetical protein
MVDCCWVGIDLHRSRSQVAVLDDGGRELLSRRIVNNPQTFLALHRPLALGPSAAAPLACAA